MNRNGGTDQPDQVRRPLTVVFVDVVGSTPLSILMDEEAYAQLIMDYRRIADRVIARHDGYVAKDEGDGRFIWFGWPIARRNDANRAVAMALELQESVGALSAAVERETGRALELRIGMHTGPVIVTFPEGSNTPSLQSATVNFAAKVQDAAPPGTVLVTEATASALVGAYELAPAPPVGIAQLDGGIEVFRVMGPDRGSRDDPFVGREAELAQLEEHWAEVVDGGSAEVVVYGPSGLGKSRLIREMRRRAGLVHFVEIQGDVDHSNHPYAALYNAVVGLMEARDSTDPDLLAWRAALGGDDGPVSVGPPSGSRPQLLEAMVDLFCQTAAETPLLVVVEDEQWLDASSADMLVRLCRRQQPGLLVVMTSRRMVEGPGWPTFVSIPLPGLTKDEARRLASEAGSVDERSNEQLIARADGNPLFLLWLARMDPDRDYEGVRRLLRPRSGVPAVVQHAVRSQLDEARVDDRFSSMAAVIGMEFSAELLATVLELPFQEVSANLSRLVDQDIMRPLDPERTRYRFTHGLVRDLAYDLLLEESCRDGHNRVGDALAAAGSKDHATMGLHFDRADRPLDACRAKLLAAGSCRRSNAYQEGAALVTRVLELVDSNELPPEVGIEARELDATFAAAVDPDSYMAGTSDRSGLLTMLDPHQEVGRVVMAKTRDWAAAMMTGDLQSSASLLYEVRRTAEKDFPEVLVCNQNARGMHANYRGRYALAERLLERSTDELAEHGLDRWLEDNWATPDDPVALAFSYAPPVFFQRGRTRTAHVVMDRAWRRADTLSGGAHTMAHVSSNAAAFWELLGDGDKAAVLGEQVAEIGRELGLKIWELNGELHARRGEALIAPTPELVTQLDADAALLDAFAPLGSGRAHLQAASAWLALEDHGRATKSLDALRAFSSATAMQYLDAEELRLRAKTLSGADKVNTLERAADVAGRQGATRYQLRALCDLAELDPQAMVGGSPVLAQVDAVRARFPEPDQDRDCERADAMLAAAPR